MLHQITDHELRESTDEDLEEFKAALSHLRGRLYALEGSPFKDATRASAKAVIDRITAEQHRRAEEKTPRIDESKFIVPGHHHNIRAHLRDFAEALVGGGINHHAVTIHFEDVAPESDPMFHAKGCMTLKSRRSCGLCPDGIIEDLKFEFRFPNK